MSDANIETITHGLEPIALIIRADYDEPGIQFFTPGSFSQMVAFMKHLQGHKITAHDHNMMMRQVLYTQCTNSQFSKHQPFPPLAGGI